MTKNNTKKALLASVVSTLLCATMLVGSTFAWFTDEATTAGNTIKAGTLDVDIVDADGNSLADGALDWVKEDGTVIEQEDILWEPNATYNLKGFKVKNNGSLALKYKAELVGITAKDKDGNEIATDGVITFTVKKNGADVNITNFEDTLLAGAVSDEITISVHMEATAGNEYQGMSIEGFGIKVNAAQATHEEDSTGDQYDADAEYANN